MEGKESGNSAEKRGREEMKVIKKKLSKKYEYVLTCVYEKSRDKQNAIKEKKKDEMVIMMSGREKVSWPFLLTWDSLGPISKVLLARLFRSRARARLVHED